MKNPFVKIFVVLLIAAGSVVACRNIIIKTAVTNACHKATGLRLYVGGLDLALFSPKVQVKDLKLYNPEGYTEKIMFDIPELYADCDLADTFSGKPHLREMRLHLAKLVVERSKDGRLNLQSLKPAGSNKEGAKPAKEEQKEKEEKK